MNTKSRRRNYVTERRPWYRQFSPNECREISATITAYAYETVANKPITIGSTTEMADEPKAPNPSLGMLAMGTDGLTLWRREEHTIAEA
jgi:hypothetical protein